MKAGEAPDTAGNGRGVSPAVLKTKKPHANLGVEHEGLLQSVSEDDRPSKY